MSQVFSRDLEKDVAGDTSGYFKKFLTSLLQVKFIVIVICRGGSRGGGRGGAGPLILNPNWGPKGRINFFGDRPPPFSKGLNDRAPLPPYLRVWLTGPPSPLISGSGWPGPPPPLSQGLNDRAPLPPYLGVWMTGPPSPLISGSGSGTDLVAGQAMAFSLYERFSFLFISLLFP